MPAPRIIYYISVAADLQRFCFLEAFVHCQSQFNCLNYALNAVDNSELWTRREPAQPKSSQGQGADKWEWAWAVVFIVAFRAATAFCDLIIKWLTKKLTQFCGNFKSLPQLFGAKLLLQSPHFLPPQSQIRALFLPLSTFSRTVECTFCAVLRTAEESKCLARNCAGVALSGLRWAHGGTARNRERLCWDMNEVLWIYSISCRRALWHRVARQSKQQLSSLDRISCCDSA